MALLEVRNLTMKFGSLLANSDVTGYPSWKMARLGLARTFQVVRPLKEMTVYENILVGAYMRYSKGQRGC